jgi:hypothetical protein
MCTAVLMVALLLLCSAAMLQLHCMLLCFDKVMSNRQQATVIQGTPLHTVILHVHSMHAQHQHYSEYSITTTYNMYSYKRRRVPLPLPLLQIVIVHCCCYYCCTTVAGFTTVLHGFALTSKSPLSASSNRLKIVFSSAVATIHCTAGSCTAFCTPTSSALC